MKRANPRAGNGASAATKLPGGVVTFFLTDLEGSTRLWEFHLAEMRSVIAGLETAVAEVAEEHGGRLLKERGEGDSSFVVFTDATEAVVAAVALQLRVKRLEKDLPFPVRLRIAIHTGSVHPERGDYFGPVVNRCARLRSVCHGEQILCSEPSAHAAGAQLPPAIQLRPLGTHQLRDVEDAFRIFQVCHPELPGDFPPLASGRSRHNLPLQLTRFVGRRQELHSIPDFISRYRIVSLVGIGGAGKTRLAVEAATAVIDEFPDGVWFIELAPLEDPRLIVAAVAQALHLRSEPGKVLNQTVQDFVRDRRLLLILDNAEHLRPATASFAESILRNAADLRLLVTSREPLGLPGEKVHRVEGLPLPADPAEDADAIRLFVERASERGRALGTSTDDRYAIFTICRTVAGLPLGLELAAARLRSTDVRELAQTLRTHLHLLGDSARHGPKRQQTISGAIDWSYQLLEPQEQRVLRHLSVFAGSWTVDAASAITRTIQPDTLDLIERLIDKSLVTITPSRRETRFTMLELVRMYASDQLARSAEQDVAMENHLAWFRDLTREAALGLRGAHAVEWTERLAEDHENIRHALDRLAQQRRHSEALELATNMWRFWQARGFSREGLARIEELCAGAPSGGPVWRGRALSGASNLAFTLGEYDRADEHANAAVQLLSTEGEPADLGWVLVIRGGTAWVRGQFADAEQLNLEALELFDKSADRVGVATALSNLGAIAHSQRDLRRALDWYERAHEINSALGRNRDLAVDLVNLGEVLYDLGDHQGAAAKSKEALSIVTELQEQHLLVIASNQLANIAMAEGDSSAATAWMRDVLINMRDIHDPYVQLRGLEDVSSLLRHRGDATGATRILGAIDQLRSRYCIPLEPLLEAQHQEVVGDVQSALGVRRFAEEQAAGKHLSLEGAIDLAIERLG